MNRPVRLLRAGIALALVSSALTSGGAAGADRAAPPLPIAREWREERIPVAPGAFAVQLAAQGDALLATWLEPLPAGNGHRVRFARRAAGERGAWSAPLTVAQSDRIFANWADTPGAIAALDGSFYVWWLEKSAPETYAYDVRLARAPASLGAWKPLGIAHEDRSPVEHGFVSAIADGRGVRLFFLDGRATAKGGPTELRSALVSGDRIGRSELIDRSVCDCCPTAAALAGERVLVAYRDRASGEVRDIRLAAPGGAAAAGEAPSVAVFDDRWKIDGCPVNGPAMAVDPRDPKRVAVAWFAAPGDRARVAAAISSDGGRSFAPPLRLDDSKPLGRTALAAVPDGFAVAWLARRAEGAELRFALFGGAGAGALRRESVVAKADPGRGSGMPRLVAAGDRLWLAWNETAGAGVRLASRPASGE